jgi:hypothetical protein
MTHLILNTARLHLVGKDLCTGLLRLCFMDIFHQHTLVLEDITLRLLVEGMIAVRIERVVQSDQRGLV